MSDTPKQTRAWAVSEDDSGLMIAHPIDDARPHDLTLELEDGDLTLHCWCRPDYRDGVIVHHSADGREAWERPQ